MTALIRSAVMTACLALIAARTPAASRPNILFIMIDDLGWMDLACQGNPIVETPNVDQLASQGMRFTNAYAAAPVCSPSRAAILTGQSPARLHITNHTPERASFVPDDAKLSPAPMRNELALSYKTIAEYLADAGYRTGFLGKWHLSGAGQGDEALGPLGQGFQTNVGGCGFGGPPTFFDPYNIPTISNRKPGEYLPDRLADEAISFLRQPSDNPFLLFLWNYTVHWPMEAPDPLLQKYASRTGHGLNDTRYGAMLEAMDTSIGRVLTALDTLALSDNTVVIFTSDNGGYGGVADNRPLRLDKGHLYEGGIRVPLIIRWPGKVARGAVSSTPVVGTDFFPTLLEIGGVQPDDKSPVDGESLVALLQQSGGLSRDAIYFHYPNYAFHRSNRLGSAIRCGDHKVIRFFDNQAVELYNVRSDISEAKNIAADMPVLARRLTQRLIDWLAETRANLPSPREPTSVP